MKAAFCLLLLVMPFSIYVESQAQTPISPGFSYKGRLVQDGVPVNGPVNLRFSLWDAEGTGQPPVGGNQLGASQLLTDVQVQEGLFMVILNSGGEFGANAFTDEARWLQIEICTDPACALTTVLAPRQPVTAVPYATQAQGPWKTKGPDVIYTNTKVGIGTSIPDTKFDVRDGRIRLKDSATGNRWDLIQYNNGNVFTIEHNASFRNFTIIGGADGRVGIGTDTPALGTKFHAITNTANYQAIRGDAPNGNGVVGTSAATGYGATAGINSGLNGIGLYGEANSGSTAYGVYGKTDNGYAVFGIGNTGYGVYGKSPNGIGVQGESTINIGVQGTSNSDSGVLGVSTSGAGVDGRSNSSSGVSGVSAGGNGVYGLSGTNHGVVGVTNRTGNDGIAGVVGIGVGGTDSIGGRFIGGVTIHGNLLVHGVVYSNKVGGVSKVDSPLDPANQYLSHVAIESSEMKNIYDGNVITDATGYAEISLPEYFEAFNKDFRYQLTVIDSGNSNQFVLAKVAKEIQGNRFTIRTSQPNVKVSWQVTGVRNDAYAQANPVIVEQPKPESERGKFLNPEAFGKPREEGIDYPSELLRLSGAIQEQH